MTISNYEKEIRKEFLNRVDKKWHYLYEEPIKDLENELQKATDFWKKYFDINNDIKKMELGKQSVDNIGLDFLKQAFHPADWDFIKYCFNDEFTNLLNRKQKKGFHGLFKNLNNFSKFKLNMNLKSPNFLAYTLGAVTIEDNRVKVNDKDAKYSMIYPEFLDFDRKKISEINCAWLLKNPGYAPSINLTNEEINQRNEYLNNTYNALYNKSYVVPWKLEDTWYNNRVKIDDKIEKLMRVEYFAYRTKDSSTIPLFINNLNKYKCYLPSQMISLRVVSALIKKNEKEFYVRAIDEWLNGLESLKELDLISKTDIEDFKNNSWKFRGMNATISENNLIKYKDKVRDSK